MLKRSIFALILVAAAGAPAFARPTHDHNPHQAPEIDANVAMGAITLLAGALTVLRTRRSR